MSKKVQKGGESETPLMKQYNEIKAKYPGALLLFRVGDFYETFGEDAVKASEILGIVLTRRANGAASHIELAGFPHHSLDTYLPKLVRAGQRVAICDQLEDPKLTKKIVKRGVTELVTPGVSYNDKILDHKQANFLCAIHAADANRFGIAFLDVSTGEFMAAEGGLEFVDKLIQSFRPSEILVSKKYQKQFKEDFGDNHYSYLLDEWIFQYKFCYEKLLNHFQTQSLKGFGMQDYSDAIVAAGVCLHYLSETHHEQSGHIQALSRLDEEKYVWLDRFTIRNLELLHTASENGTPLIQILDQTVSPMGARLLKKWLLLPLRDISLISERLHMVEVFTQQIPLYQLLVDELKPVGDLERLVSKIATQRITPRELQQLNRALKHILPIRKALLECDSEVIRKMALQIQDCSWVMETLDKHIVEEAPALTNRGGIFRSGIHTELDELRDISSGGKEYLLKIQQEEQQRTGISSLKISYNNVFGYYIEVTNTHKHKVPPEWIRKQTLANAERYITEELKTYEEKILGAEEKLTALEERLFHELILSLSDYVTPIQQNAHVLARVDCLLSFAYIARQNQYCKPVLHDGFHIELTDARHPVIEKSLAPGEKYIANNVRLDPEQQQIIILTGPNMSGKSAILRQTALCVLMAQIGSFVPAKSANIGWVDKIFTRVGASDNLSAGESTFMVEMSETASILHNLSNRSLILLDEIGRGTATYDGVSIAWAIAEYLHRHPYKPKTLFATHYHELNELEKSCEGVHNYHISIQETRNKIVFLRKLEPGGSEHSFGIHVARMAGIPKTVLDRADEILKELEEQRGDPAQAKNQRVIPKPSIQLSMFEMNDPAMSEMKEFLKNLDVNRLTPVEALLKLQELKSRIR